MKNPHPDTITPSTTLDATVSAFAALSLGNVNEDSTVVQNTIPLKLIPPSTGAGNSMLESINLDGPISPLFLDFDNSKPRTMQDNKEIKIEVDSGSNGGDVNSSKGENTSGSAYHSKSNQEGKLRGLASMTAGNEGRKRSPRSELHALRRSALRRWGVNKTDTNSSSRRELGQDLRQAVATSAVANAMEIGVIAVGSRCQDPETDTGFVAEHSISFKEAWNEVPIISIIPTEGRNPQTHETNTASVAGQKIPLNEARNDKDVSQKREVKQKKVVVEKRLLQLPSTDKKTRAQRRILVLRLEELQKKIETAEDKLAKSKTAPSKTSESKTSESKTSESKTSESKTTESKMTESKATEEKKTTPRSPPPSSHPARIEKKSVSEKNKVGKQRTKKRNITAKEIAALSFLIEGLNVDGIAVGDGHEKKKT